MAYLRCESCGSKALSAASQCPRCAAPFDMTDSRGFRASLKKCGGCGIMHRQDRNCHWCGERSVPVWRSAKVLSSAAALTLFTLAGVGVYGYRAPLRDTAALIVGRALAPAPRAQTALFVPLSSTQPAEQSAAQLHAVPPPSSDVATAGTTTFTDSTVTAAAFDAGTLFASAPDSIRWIPAVARTWVNVRNDASRDGSVVGVINPASRAMLGTTRAGWRQVKSTDVTGWVDPRLFESDSLRTRG